MNLPFCDGLTPAAKVVLLSGAYEPPKAAKEHATYAVHRVPSQSQSKFKTHYYLISFLIPKAVSHYLKLHKSGAPNTPSRSRSGLNRSARQRLKWQEQW